MIGCNAPNNSLRRFIPDALVGLSVFVLTLVLTLGDASAQNILTDALTPGADGRQGTSMLLAAAFAAIVTLDLAFVRHVVCTYTSPRRAGRRAAGRSNSENAS